MRMRIGFLGLGTMGEPIANNLRKAGHELTVWNRTAAKASHIVVEGRQARAGRRASAPPARDLVITCVSDEKALEAVLEGPDGVARRRSREGDVLVDMSTAGTRSARSVAERAAERGARFVAGPILGSKSGRGAGAAGPRRRRPRRGAREGPPRPPRGLGAPLRARRRGPGGAPEAVRERGRRRDDHRLRRGARARRPPAALPSGGWSRCCRPRPSTRRSSSMKGELVEQQDYAPRFAVALAEKDQRLAQEAAAGSGREVPINEAVRRLLAEAAESGRGDKDVAAIADLFLEWAKGRCRVRAERCSPAWRAQGSRLRLRTTSPQGAPRSERARRRVPTPERAGGSGARAPRRAERVPPA